MAELSPSFQGEVLLRRWSESSTQGVQITFALTDAAELEPLKIKTGKRFAAVLVEIGDNEQPIMGNPISAKPREHLGDLCYRAVQWCNDPEFWAWVNSVTFDGVFWHVGSSSEAAVFIKELCGVASRKELDTNPEARAVFLQKIVGPWRKRCQARGLS